MEIAADLVTQNKLTNMEQLTGVLHIFAKFNFLKTESIDSAIELMQKEPKLDIKIVCKNLYNLFALDYKSEEGLELFSDVIVRVGPAYRLPDFDLALALKTFAHFNHKEDEQCLEILVKQSIRTVNEMSLSTLASVVHSCA